MNTRIVLIGFLLLLASASLGAQEKGKVVFAKPIHDFGYIVEAKGKASYTFEFKNEGSYPIILSSVIASCGCTTPEWTKEPVAPGKVGKVVATYDPTGRPGPFDKSLTVLSNGTPSSVVLRIRGEVVKAMPTTEEQFPIAVGDNLRLKADAVGFARIAEGSTKAETFDVINNGNSSVAVAFEDIPAHLDVKIDQAKIAPKQKATITITYNASKKKDWGFVKDVIAIAAKDGKKVARAKLTVSATIIDDFSKLTPEQRSNTPYPQLKSSRYDFGNVTQGSMVNTTFIITNSGKRDLIIRKVGSEFGNVTASVSKNVLKAGESTELKVNISTKDANGRVTYPVSLYSNSASSPQVNVLISGTVVK